MITYIVRTPVDSVRFVRAQSYDQAIAHLERTSVYLAADCRLRKAQEEDLAMYRWVPIEDAGVSA